MYLTKTINLRNNIFAKENKKKYNNNNNKYNKYVTIYSKKQNNQKFQNIHKRLNNNNIKKF